MTVAGNTSPHVEINSRENAVTGLYSTWLDLLTTKSEVILRLRVCGSHATLSRKVVLSTAISVLIRRRTPHFRSNS